ncbi:hypothetical protein ACWKWA_13770, partial [Dermacoccus abyssi]
CCSFDNPAMTPTIPYRWWCVDRLNPPPFTHASGIAKALTWHLNGIGFEGVDALDAHFLCGSCLSGAP